MVSAGDGLVPDRGRPARFTGPVIAMGLRKRGGRDARGPAENEVRLDNICQVLFIG